MQMAVYWALVIDLLSISTERGNLMKLIDKYE